MALPIFREAPVTRATLLAKHILADLPYSGKQTFQTVRLLGGKAIYRRIETAHEPGQGLARAHLYKHPAARRQHGAHAVLPQDGHGHLVDEGGYELVGR